MGFYMWNQTRMLGGWMPTAFALALIASSLLSVSFYLALGYAIEKLAKIEWNTRPEHQRLGALSSSDTAVSGVAAKRFYVVTSGQTHGPLSSQGMLNLYRDGKLTRSSQILVDENGYRRAVTDWSEFGL